MKKIKVSIHGIAFSAYLQENETAEAVWNSLPLEGKISKWGDEIFFDADIGIDREIEAKAHVDIGSLGYWPSGKVFCIFYGPTPISTNTMPRAAAPVNIFARTKEDLSMLRATREGMSVLVTKDK